VPVFLSLSASDSVLSFLSSNTSSLLDLIQHLLNEILLTYVIYRMNDSSHYLIT